MATFAGHYAEALIDLDGDALVSTSVKVYLDGSSTLATLYSDRTKTLAASNPATTNARGNLEIFADPGDYEGAAVVGGVEQSRFPIIVSTDPAEAGGVADGGVTTAKLADSAVTAVKLADDSVTDAKVSSAAAISESKLALASDAAAAVASRRTLGTGPNQAAAGNDTRLGDARTPTGAAGGALTGTYPNPTIADGSVANAKLATNPLARANHAGTQTAATVSDFDTTVRANRLDQMAPPTAAVDLGGQKLTGLGTPTLGTDAATKTYADAIASGLDPKASVRLATAAALPAVTYANGASGVGATLTANAVGALTVDGVAVALNNRLLVKNQASALQNGIYTVSTLGTGGVAFVLTRATDADTAAEVTAGLFTFIEEGSTLADSGWVLITNGAITIGTTSQDFTQFSGGTGGGGGAPTGAAGGSLAGSYPNPSLAAGAVGATEVSATIKDPAAGTAGLRTLGTGATQAAAGTDARLSDSRAPSGAAGGDLAGSYPNPTLAPGSVSDGDVAVANKDGNAAVPSLRTLGGGATQAAAGNDARFFDARPPTGAAGGVLSGSYPNPAFAVDMATQTELDAHTGNGAIHGGGGGAGYSAVMDEGIARTARSTLNFVGAGVTASDDSTNARTIINIPGGAAGAGDNALNDVFNVKSYGAVGDGVVDDTSAIQAAVDAAAAAGGGTVFFPGGIFQISATIIWKLGVSLRGESGVIVGGDGVPNIRWQGAAGGTMVQTDTIGGNRPFKSVKRLVFIGRTPGNANVAGIGVRFTDRVDLGTLFEECSIMRINGVGLQFDSGGINFEWHGGRFDSIRDWCVRWIQGNRSDRFLFEQFTIDNNPQASDPTVVPGGGGFMWWDGSGNGNNSQLHATIAHAKLEINKNLNLATHGANVDATIKLQCNPFITGDKVVIELIMDDVWFSNGGGITINDTTNPSVKVTPQNNFIDLHMRACRRAAVTGIPAYNNLLTGASRYISSADVHPMTPRHNTAPAISESSAIELAGLLNIHDLAVRGKFAYPVIQSTGADWTVPTTLWKGWLLEDPATITAAGTTRWKQVVSNCTVGPALSGVTVTRTTANQGTLSDITNVWPGQFIVVDANTYEVTAQIPASGTIEVFPNWVTTPAGSAVTYAPLVTRDLFLMSAAASTPNNADGTIGEIRTNTADTGAAGQVILWKKNAGGTWTALTR